MANTYMEDLKIDKNNLEQEWLRQPQLYMSWARQAIEAQEERDDLKRKLDIERAKLDGEIRANPGRFGLDKITEAGIQSTISVDKKFQEKTKEYLESVSNAKLLDAARDAFEHRKKALENLTQLLICGYFSVPKLDPSLKEKSTDRKTESQREKLAESSRLKNRR